MPLAPEVLQVPRIRSAVAARLRDAARHLGDVVVAKVLQYSIQRGVVVIREAAFAAALALARTAHRRLAGAGEDEDGTFSARERFVGDGERDVHLGHGQHIAQRAEVRSRTLQRCSRQRVVFRFPLLGERARGTLHVDARAVELSAHVQTARAQVHRNHLARPRLAAREVRSQLSARREGRAGVAGETYAGCEVVCGSVGAAKHGGGGEEHHWTARLSCAQQSHHLSMHDFLRAHDVALVAGDQKVACAVARDALRASSGLVVGNQRGVREHLDVVRHAPGLLQLAARHCAELSVRRYPDGFGAMTAAMIRLLPVPVPSPSAKARHGGDCVAATAAATVALCCCDTSDSMASAASLAGGRDIAMSCVSKTRKDAPQEFVIYYFCNIE